MPWVEFRHHFATIDHCWSCRDHRVRLLEEDVSSAPQETDHGCVIVRRDKLTRECEAGDTNFDSSVQQTFGANASLVTASIVLASSVWVSKMAFSVWLAISDSLLL
ncbi:unnamed protein product [Phytophthora fragariaefolia]|uniref:Unnamed protein product n=1 Tax=Phytophthora fragariaefolia TaxID=1490495 RepID=A0A9W6YJF9_9STRA|nr:unnamed protein product [Phytophthora fragariaefolia]